MSMSKTATPPNTIADDIAAFLQRFIAFPDPHYADVMALYIIHTHAVASFKVTPYLYINSPEKGSGKTLTLELFELLCRNATMAANLSTSSLFRIIEARRPTVLIDEVDAIWSGAKNEELRGVINSGYKSTGKVWRAVGSPNDEDGGVKEFSTYCPKVLAGIDNGLIPDTIMDRSIILTLKRATNEQMKGIEDFYPEDVEDDAAELIARITAFVTDNAEEFVKPENRPARIDSLNPRANEIARPLLIIANRLPNWHVRAVSALTVMLDRSEPMPPNHMALLQIRDWFLRNPEAKHIRSSIAMEITGQNGKQLGWWFKDLNITPGTYSIEGRNAKGYKKDAFTDAFERFLPAID